MPPSRDADDEWGAVGARLRRPERSLLLLALPEAFAARRLRLRLPGLGPLGRDPGLIGRIRGAFGSALAEAASPEAVAGAPCPWRPPCAFEALFRKQGRMTAGLDFPAAWTLAVDPDRRGDLHVALTLMGFATEWMPAAAEILGLALTHRVDWAGATGLFHPPPRIAGRVLDAVECPAPPAGPCGGLDLDLLTPLVTTGAGPLRDPAAAFVGYGHRLEGLARWHGATLAGTDWRALAAALRGLSYRWIEPERIAWTRGSRRQDRSIPMQGIVGRLAIDGAPEVLAAVLPVFLLGAVTHVGADIAFGCGRYRLTVTA